MKQSKKWISGSKVHRSKEQSTGKNGKRVKFGDEIKVKAWLMFQFINGMRQTLSNGGFSS